MKRSEDVEVTGNRQNWENWRKTCTRGDDGCDWQHRLMPKHRDAPQPWVKIHLCVEVNFLTGKIWKKIHENLDKFCWQFRQIFHLPLSYIKAH